MCPRKSKSNYFFSGRFLASLRTLDPFSPSVRRCARGNVFPRRSGRQQAWRTSGSGLDCSGVELAPIVRKVPLRRGIAVPRRRGPFRKVRLLRQGNVFPQLQTKVILKNVAGGARRKSPFRWKGFLRQETRFLGAAAPSVPWVRVRPWSNPIHFIYVLSALAQGLLPTRPIS